MAEIHITTFEEFEKEVLEEKDKIVLVDFWAVWCAPCHMLAPVLKALEERYQDKVKIVKVNVDVARDLAQKYGIMSIPTVYLFKDGAEVKQFIGVQPLDVYASAIEALLDGSSDQE